MTRTSYILMSW